MIIVGSLFIFDVKSWRNSNTNGSNGFFYALTPKNYETHYYQNSDMGLTSYFGTHDWIAESALILLEQTRPQHNFIRLLFDDTKPYNLKMYFLLGTEAPDAINSDEPAIARMSLTGCNGKTYGCRGTDEKVPRLAHHVYYDGIVPYDTRGADGAFDCYLKAQKAFIERDCKKAAFFLGAMCHFIADCACYPHILDYNRIAGVSEGELEHQHKVLEKYIGWLTWRVHRFRAIIPLEFFSIQWAKDQFTSLLGEDGWMATYKTGLATDEHAVWFYNEMKDREIYYFPDGYKSNARDRMVAYTRDDFPKDGSDRQIFFERIEEALNQAILNCAEAINLALNSYIDCECGTGKKKPEELYQSIAAMAANWQAQIYFLAIASTNLIITLLITSQVAIIAKKDEVEFINVLNPF